MLRQSNIPGGHVGCKDNTVFWNLPNDSIKRCVKMCLVVNNLKDYSYLCRLETKYRRYAREVEPIRILSARS